MASGSMMQHIALAYLGKLCAQTVGQCMNFNVRWVARKFKRALMRQVWWQNFSAFAASLLFEDPTHHHNLDGEPPSLSDLLAQLPPDPTHPSRLPPHPP